MLVVENGSPFCELTCRICHCRFGPGDRILHIYHRGDLRAIHAHACRAPSREQYRPPGMQQRAAD